jgi:hypothetical protein
LVRQEVLNSQAGRQIMKRPKVSILPAGLSFPASGAQLGAIPAARTAGSRLALAPALALAAVLAGCGDSAKTEAKPTNGTSSGNPLTAPVDYLGAVGKAQKTAGKTVSSAGLTQAIKMFEAQEGRLPKSLNELVPEFMDKVPPPPAGMKYVYNPADGSLKVVPQ